MPQYWVGFGFWAAWEGSDGRLEMRRWQRVQVRGDGGGCELAIRIEKWLWACIKYLVGRRESAGRVPG